MEAHNYIESFLDYTDAFVFLESKIQEYAYPNGMWQIKDTSGIQFMNYQWRVGISFERKIPREIEATQVQ